MAQELLKRRERIVIKIGEEHLRLVISTMTSFLPFTNLFFQLVCFRLSFSFSALIPCIALLVL